MGSAFQRPERKKGEGQVARERTSRGRARGSPASRAVIAHRDNSALQARRLQAQRSQPLRSFTRLIEINFPVADSIRSTLALRPEGVKRYRVTGSSTATI